MKVSIEATAEELKMPFPNFTSVFTEQLKSAYLDAKAQAEDGSEVKITVEKIDKAAPVDVVADVKQAKAKK